MREQCALVARARPLAKPDGPLPFTPGEGRGHLGATKPPAPLPLTFSCLLVHGDHRMRLRADPALSGPTLCCPRARRVEIQSELRASVDHVRLVSNVEERIASRSCRETGRGTTPRGSSFVCAASPSGGVRQPDQGGRNAWSALETRI